MPSLVDYLAKKSKDNDLEIINQEKPETMKLHLPSSISPDVRGTVCTAQLTKIEAELRHALCYDTLKGLRMQLRQ
jgi:hypothetical protein